MNLEKNFTIRPMEKEDVPFVHAIQTESYLEHLWENQETYQIRLKRCPESSWVIEMKDPKLSQGPKIKAYLQGQLIAGDEVPLLHTTKGAEQDSAPANPDRFFIYDVAVAKDSRGLRLGNQLIDQAFHYALSQKIHLINIVSVAASVDFWLRLGFKPRVLTPEQNKKIVATYGVGSMAMFLNI